MVLRNHGVQHSREVTHRLENLPYVRDCSVKVLRQLANCLAVLDNEGVELIEKCNPLLFESKDVILDILDALLTQPHSCVTEVSQPRQVFSPDNLVFRLFSLYPFLWRQQPLPQIGHIWLRLKLNLGKLPSRAHMQCHFVELLL